MYYPLLLNIQKKNIVIVGIGHVGRRKLLSLLPCFPQSISLYDPQLTKEKLSILIKAVQELGKVYHYSTEVHSNYLINAYKGEQINNVQSEKKRTHIYFHTKEFIEKNLANVGLLFAATNSRKENKYLSSLCNKKDIPCNIVDAENESSFIIPAVVRKKGITISIATNGQSPALTRRIKADIEQYIGNKYSSLSIVLGRLRPLVLINSNSDENAQLFRNIVSSPLAEYLEQGNIDAAKDELITLLPKSLHNAIGELLNDL